MPAAIEAGDFRAVVTGGGSGLGRAYCLDLAAAGFGHILINDADSANAHAVAKEVEAIFASSSSGNSKKTKPRVAVTPGRIGEESQSCEEQILRDCVSHFGGPPTAVVNNAGILRDAAFKNQSEAQWSDIYRVHLSGMRNLTRLLWPHFLEQKFGKIVNISSMNGVCGAFGQSNYAAMKTALIGFTKSLAKEGKKNNVCANVIIPTALTAMTKTVGLQHYTDNAGPQHVAPLVTFLLHPSSNHVTGRVFEGAPGFYAELRFQRSFGKYFAEETRQQPRVRQRPVTWEDIRDNWKDITLFDERADDPSQESGPPRSLKLAVKHDAKL
ncbi:unnamed protein product [Amoebophrya sp. A25]|nr:unnamed protein product [Amoebophrya sp. A25]|eukprot:GSA25T00016687001.1